MTPSLAPSTPTHVPLLALLITAFVLPLSACGFGADQVSGRLTETITAGDYQLTVSSMENPAERPDRFTNPKIGNRFVKFEIEVVNRGQLHLPVAAAYFTMKDSGGIDNDAMPGIPTDKGIKLTSLGPGQRIQAPMFFEMAANQSPTELVFAPAVVGWRTRIAVNLKS